MDRSILRLPDPASRLPGAERRRPVRQKLHTPVYVSFQSPHAGMIVDLNELLDIHENGFAVQTAVPAGTDRSSRLEVSRPVPLRLDLTETKSYIDATGEVMWIDHGGRAGIRFSSLPERSRHVLKEWLFANLLIASANHAARAAEVPRPEPEDSSGNDCSAKGAVQALPDETAGMSAPIPVAMPIIVPQMTPVAAEQGPTVPDQSRYLLGLEDVRRQVCLIRDRPREASEVDQYGAAQGYASVLQIIIGSAMNLTAATGVALAMITDDRMICRASMGDPAPPLGSEVDARNGLSGECIRTGLLVSCEDTEADLRVDPEVCRALRIGSFMAAPVFDDFRVVGLLEIFSPYPHTFTALHATILERLVEMIPPPEREQRETATIVRREIVAAGIETTKAQFPPIDFVEHVPAQPSSERYTLENPVSEAPDVTGAPVSEAVFQEQESVPLLPARRVHFGHFALLILVLGTIALVMGYLLAPTIQKHWMTSTPASETSGVSNSQNLLQPLPATSLQNAAARQTRQVSPEELRKLANAGDGDAQWQLGTLYHDGLAVPQDDAQAVQWFQRAAEQGYVRAQATLGSYYWAGRGVPQNFSKAYFWSQLALAGGDQNSKLLLEGLSTQMTQSQITNARQEAELWLHAHTQPAKPSPGVK